MTEKNNIIYFESDEEFTDFCLAPYAVLKETPNGILTYTGNYSETYLKCLKQGKVFIIKDEDSKVCERQCVNKRVPLKINGHPSYDRMVLVQLPVENLHEYFGY